MTPTVRLVERRTVVRPLPRADAAAVVADWSHVVELTPTADRGSYRLTARGWAGGFRTSGRLWEVAPKLGWGVAERLIGMPVVGPAADVGDEFAAGLRSALARRLASLMAERAAAGLVRGYAESRERSPVLRGRIDFPAEARRRPTAPLGFEQVADDYTADQPWNGWPVRVAGHLLDGPLPNDVRSALASSVRAFGDIRPRSSTDPDAFSDDPRLSAYRPLLGWCRVVEDALAGGAVLVNLEHLFEEYVSRLTDRPGPLTAVAQRPLPLRGTAGLPAVELRPDLTVFDATGEPVAVWDAKWKPLTAAGPHPDDLHQVLGYAAALGVRSAGLVYPGRRFSVGRYHTPGGVTVTVASCRLTGDPAVVRRADAKLRRLLVRP